MTDATTNGFAHAEVVQYAVVVTALSALIMQAERACKAEQTFPGFDPDKMDDKIKHYADRVEKLRDLREQFESLINTPAP